MSVPCPAAARRVIPFGAGIMLRTHDSVKFNLVRKIEAGTSLKNRVRTRCTRELFRRVNR